MEMHGQRFIQASTDAVWSGLNDPEVLKVCLPGCDTVEPIGENQYAVAMAVKVGPVAARFTGKITLSDILPPNSYKLAFEGKGGAAGFGKGSSSVRLKPADDGCELAYTVQAQVGGKLAQLGQRLIDGAAKSMADDFFKRFDEEMHKRHPFANADTITASDHAPESAGQGFSGVPSWVWLGGGVALIALIWLLLRG